MLGACHDYGKSVAKDQAEAVKWYRKFAEQGNAPAQSELGYCYYYGRGVPKDETEAAKWYNEAAKRWHKGAKIISKRIQTGKKFSIVSAVMWTLLE